jgi:hypothetical protein
MPHRLRRSIRKMYPKRKPTMKVSSSTTDEINMPAVPPVLSHLQEMELNHLGRLHAESTNAPQLVSDEMAVQDEFANPGVLLALSAN